MIEVTVDLIQFFYGFIGASAALIGAEISDGSLVSRLKWAMIVMFVLLIPVVILHLAVIGLLEVVS